ncbi:ankyrin repeat domain-containing protein [Massilia sp. YIM B04103]|uniref:ankyrin repeat domain-containing protein n=1 Tax=Massilia sp. YIM B04103 TaxID=2963106 RepID=UPI00210EA6E9|nr:ankyrin repeat domain-containing protein [Massilia sp. YIM B04103]
MKADDSNTLLRRRELLRAAASAALALAAAVTGTQAIAADLPSKEEDAVTFFRAAQLDDVGRVKTVLARGLDPNLHEPERGETGLIVAMRYDAMKVFGVLMAHPQIQLEAQAANGSTALMMAAFKRNQVAVKKMIGSGAQVNRPGWAPLHFAAAAGDTEMIALLLAHHAYIDAASPSGMTPLMIAAREGHEDAAKLLLAEGADASLKDGAFKIDAAEFALRADKPWIAEAIRHHLASKR